MKYDKLVRNKIPQIIEMRGKKCKYRTLSPEEYRVYLHKKLVEEVEEFNETPNLEEAADVMEVFDSLCNVYALSFREIVTKMNEKAKDKGYFSNRFCLEEVE